jgi:hypothetical protein
MGVRGEPGGSPAAFQPFGAAKGSVCIDVFYVYNPWID